LPKQYTSHYNQTSLTKSFKVIEKKLEKRADFSPIIDALLNLAQNFSNQQDVQQIISLLNELRNDTVDQLNQDAQAEADKQNEW